MLKKLCAMLKKHGDIVAYLVFGVLTTAVNYAVYLPCYNLLCLPAAVSNAISWATSVIFAFLTNKPFVFQSHDWAVAILLPELAKFVGSRLFSGALETVILFAATDVLGWNGNGVKVVTSVLVVAFNYFASKLLVFRKREKSAESERFR